MLGTASPGTPWHHVDMPGVEEARGRGVGSSAGEGDENPKSSPSVVGSQQIIPKP